MNHKKLSKYYKHDSLKSFFSLIMSLSTALIVKNINILRQGVKVGPEPGTPLKV